MILNYPQKSNGMYYLSREDIDVIATQYLKEYMPSVFERTQSLDVKYLAEEVCFLTLKNKWFAFNQPVLGLVAFLDINIELYNDKLELVVEEVKEGTIIIDTYLCQRHNLQRYRFTLAHEIAHWLLHRSYHSSTNNKYQLRSSGDTESFIACKSVNIESNSRLLITDDDWEEWQADSLAAALLMPVEPFKKVALESYKKAKRYLARFNYSNKDIENEIKERLSSIFKVSFTSVQIRIKQLNLFKDIDSNLFSSLS